MKQIKLVTEPENIKQQPQFYEPETQLAILGAELSRNYPDTLLAASCAVEQLAQFIAASSGNEAAAGEAERIARILDSLAAQIDNSCLVVTLCLKALYEKAAEQEKQGSSEQLRTVTQIADTLSYRQQGARPKRKHRRGDQDGAAGCSFLHHSTEREATQ